jgi:hypothetical protein
VTLSSVRSALLDDDVTAFLSEQRRRTAAEFDVELANDTMPELEWGETPEYRVADGGPRIFVARNGADWWRIRYQIAHEVFHWLCTPPRTFHWVHELFAVEVAVRALEELGEHDYVRRAKEALIEGATQLPLAAMLTTPLAVPYTDGLYGRAWLTGRELQEAIGWGRLKPLATSFDDQGKPDVTAWIDSLARRERLQVEAVLGSPSPAWV